jgi:hypothetical protein
MSPAPAQKPATASNITAAPVKQTGLVNASSDASQSLQNFELPDLQQFTREGAYSNNASKDFHLFYVGRDNVHEILKYVLSRTSVSLYLNMFGFDDDELNQILMEKAVDPNVTMLITLDKSQAGGVHEKALIAADQKLNLAAYNTHFVVGQSLTGQISHTKGFVSDGLAGGEGSTNWSNSGEGTFVNGTWNVTGKSAPAGPVSPGKGYQAQNNTQSIFTDPDTINRFQSELIAEHLIAQKQPGATSNAPLDKTKAAAVPDPKTAVAGTPALATKGAAANKVAAAPKTAPKTPAKAAPAPKATAAGKK